MRGLSWCWTHKIVSSISGWMQNWKRTTSRDGEIKGSRGAGLFSALATRSFLSVATGSSLTEANSWTSWNDYSECCRCPLKSTNRKWSNIAPTASLKQYVIELTSVPNIFLKILKLLSSFQKWKSNQITQVHISVKRTKMYHQFWWSWQSPYNPTKRKDFSRPETRLTVNLKYSLHSHDHNQLKNNHLRSHNLLWTLS